MNLQVEYQERRFLVAAPPEITIEALKQFIANTHYELYGYTIDVAFVKDGYGNDIPASYL